jgi:hypothetical protein
MLTRKLSGILLGKNVIGEVLILLWCSTLLTTASSSSRSNCKMRTPNFDKEFAWLSDLTAATSRSAFIDAVFFARKSATIEPPLMIEKGQI